MKKSLMNIRNFVLDSNVMQRIDRVANNNDFFGDDLLLVERQFEELKNVCIDSEKRISAMLQSLSSSNPTTLVGTYTQNVHASLSNITSTSPQPSSSAHVDQNETGSNKSTKQHFKSVLYQNDSIPGDNKGSYNPSQKFQNPSKHINLPEEFRKFKKLAIIGYLKFLIKSNDKLKSDSILATSFSQCSKLQNQLIKLYLAHEQKVESQCLKPIQQLLEVDIPNIMRLRKLFIKSHNDLDSVTSKYNGANQKQQQSNQQSSQHHHHGNITTQTTAQQAHTNKIEQLRKEMDENLMKFEQAKDIYSAELYAFVCKETELVRLFRDFYQFQTEYHQQVALTIQGSLPLLDNILITTPRKPVFGLPLNEHLSHTGRSRSLVIDLCIHLLYTNALDEEGLFRIPGSSIKIKNLKNAINAWFVTLASQSELAHDAQSSVDGACPPSMIAIYNLFKHVVSRKPFQAVDLIAGDSSLQAITAITIGQDSGLSNSTSSTTCNNRLVFDVHTIAGLLKLYLRELPEPLFTHALYRDFIDATLKTLTNEPGESSLKQLISRLPKTNYENLRHLIRFLHLLTCHSEQNKMTATNLAITMAPSLIWAQPQITTTENGIEPQLGDMQMMNMQMCNVGMFASLHAKVIENLISHAEDLFPGSVKFSLYQIVNYEESFSSDTTTLPKQDGFQKSASPTGLSTASSSSFSSTSSKGKHNRKGGSMEGLMNDNSNITLTSRPHFNTARPVSMNLSANKRGESHNNGDRPPPPVPPAPTRSHLRNTCDQLTHRTFSSHQKPPAPPPPPSATTLLRRAKEQQLKQQNSEADNTSRNMGCPTKSSGRNRTIYVSCPNVPPPDPPFRSSPVLDDELDIAASSPYLSPTTEQGGLSSEIRSLSSPTDSELRTDSAEDDIDISVSVSPAISLSSGSHSDIHNQAGEPQSSLETPVKRSESANVTGKYVHDSFDKNPSKSESTSMGAQDFLEEQIQTTNGQKSIKPGLMRPLTKPPKPPPRSSSPKASHSTPL